MNKIQWFLYRLLTHIYLRVFGVPMGTHYNPCHVDIGFNTGIASNVVLATMDHSEHDPYLHIGVRKIVIGDNCFIGANSVILPGVVLGDNTIVGAGSVVTRSFPRGFVVLAGCPARVVRTIKPRGVVFEELGMVVP